MSLPWRNSFFHRALLDAKGMLRLAGLALLLLLSPSVMAATPLHNDVLVFVPAYEASQLFDTNLNKAKDEGPPCVWGNYNTFLSSKLYFSLRMPNPLIAKPLLAVGPIDVYRKFVTTLTEPSDDTPNFHPYTLGSDFFIFTYDWRQEIATVSAPLFDQALERYAQIHESKTGIPARQTRFTIVTHSMGGLVVRTLLAEKPELASRISRLYLVGSPNAGSVKAIETVVVGPDSIEEYANGFPGALLNLSPTDVDQNVTKLVGITRPSLYELLPSIDPHWSAVEAGGKQLRVRESDVLQASSWEIYWPTSGLEKKLFLDGWLKDREKEGRKSIRLTDWEFCQDADYSKLKLLLAETMHWRRLMGPLSETNRLMTHPGQASRLRVIFSSGLKTPTGVVTTGSHDSSQAYYLYDPPNSGDGTMEAKRVIDDLPTSSSNLVQLNKVPHGRLMIDPQFLRYFVKELSGESITGSRP
jgi:pimeloyl-ACP methyl ester carboxylesterase